MDQRVSTDEADTAYAFVPSAPPQVSRRWLLRIGVVITVGAVLAAPWAILSGHRAAAQLREATEAQALVSVATTHPEPVGGESELVLPGNLQANYEAPIYARTSGYLK